MVFKKNVKGQAAIEFLMTYGWMLLVVLIVGALIFSFVDFGSLLPNKVELSNNLRGSATDSFADSATNIATVVFVYNGAKKVMIAGAGSNIANDVGADCPSANITNIDTGAISNSTAQIAFLNGQTAIMRFNCSSEGLMANDALEGKLKVPVVSAKTGLSIPSMGTIRLTIS
jgi:hypothetical protein